jgi:hypothetical protein
MVQAQNAHTDEAEFYPKEIDEEEGVLTRYRARGNWLPMQTSTPQKVNALLEVARWTDCTPAIVGNTKWIVTAESSREEFVAETKLRPDSYLPYFYRCEAAD